MPKETEKLNPNQVKNLTEPGWYGDGENLWLVITKAGGKSWVYRYKVNYKQKVLGLGAYSKVTLKQARDLAKALRYKQATGIDPADERQAQKIKDDKIPTFKAACTAYISAQKHAWTNPKHAAQWTSTLDTYAVPIIGGMKVSAIQASDVIRVLEPIWTIKTETASRVRMRIEKVLGYCTTKGYRAGDNPARWKGHLEHSLAKPTDVTQKENQPSLPWARMSEFMAELKTRGGMGARALEFAIYTAARAKQVRLAEWSEVDLDKRVWMVPAEHMKAEKAHAVPLSDAAVDLLRKLPRINESKLIFPSTKHGVPMSEAAMGKVIKDMNEKLKGDQRYTDPATGRDVVPHGFRTSFRTWAADKTNIDREPAEHALAHQLPDKVEAAYQRSAVFTKRIALMQVWSQFATGKPFPENVIDIDHN